MKVHVWSPQIKAFGGGIGAFSRESATGLKSLGHEVELISKGDASGQWNGMQVRGAGNAAPRFRTADFVRHATTAAVRARPDLIVTTHVNFAPVAFAIRELLGIPYMIAAHGVDVAAGSRLRVAAVRSAARVIAVSSWTRRKVQETWAIDSSKISLLSNTFDSSRFAPGPRPAEIFARHGIGNNEKIILTVARLASREQYKGYDRLILSLPEVLESLPNVRLVIVGEGDDSERIKDLAKRCGVQNNIVLAGFISDEDLPDYYRAADVFAMPSTSEGFGVVFLESMGCGTPVLAGNADGSVDAVDHGKLGAMVNPLDVGQIARGLVRLLEKRGLPIWFNREALHCAVVERFGRDQFRQRLEKIVQLGVG